MDGWAAEAQVQGEEACFLVQVLHSHGAAQAGLYLLQP